jgi:hypothetical protein
MGATGDMFDGLAGILQTAGVGRYIPPADTTSVFVSGDTAIARLKLPSAPDRAVSLRVMRTVADVVYPFSTFLVQALTRGLPNNPNDAVALTDAVTFAILGLTNIQMGATHLVQVRFAGTIDLDEDDSMRSLWSTKFLADVDEPPTSLRPEGGAWD